MKDKEIEKSRYDLRAQKLLSVETDQMNREYSLTNLPLDLRFPYTSFRDVLNKRISQKSQVLEIAAGTGAVTEWLINTGGDITSTDISTYSVKFLNKKYRNVKRFKAIEADMEALPFHAEKFDIVVCAGGLSYGDNIVTRNEIFRVLKADGSFICIDSLNHNPIFRANRFLHYLRGNRSRNTLLRMPTLKLIDGYEEKFGSVERSFFGSLSWLFPVLRTIFGESKSSNLGRWFDTSFSVKRSAFKFIMIAKKNNLEINR